MYCSMEEPPVLQPQIVLSVEIIVTELRNTINLLCSEQYQQAAVHCNFFGSICHLWKYLSASDIAVSNLDTLAIKGGGIQRAESCNMSSAVLYPCHGQRSGNLPEISFDLLFMQVRCAGVQADEQIMVKELLILSRNEVPFMEEIRLFRLWYKSYSKFTSLKFHQPLLHILLPDVKLPSVLDPFPCF